MKHLILFILIIGCSSPTDTKVDLPEYKPHPLIGMWQATGNTTRDSSIDRSHLVVEFFRFDSLRIYNTARFVDWPGEWIERNSEIYIRDMGYFVWGSYSYMVQDSLLMLDAIIDPAVTREFYFDGSWVKIDSINTQLSKEGIGRLEKG